MFQFIREKIVLYFPKGLGKQISLVVIGDAITVLSSIISGMILARLMLRESMGTYRQIMYVGPLAVSIVELGVSGSVYRFWNTLNDEQRASYLKMIVLVMGTLGLVAALFLAFMAPTLAIWYRNPDLKLALLIASPYPLAAIPLMFIRPILLSQGFSLRATILETGFSLIAIAAIAIPTAFGYPLNVAIAIWISAMLLRLCAVPLVLGRYLFATAAWWDDRILTEVWSYVWPIQVSRIPGLITTYLDQIVMSIYLKPKDFAVYSLGAREIPLIGVIGPSVSTVLIPHLVEDVENHRTEQICRRWEKACYSTAFVTYPIAAFCIIYAAPVMTFFFSAKYIGSSIPFRIFAFITFLRVIEYASLARAINRTNIIFHAAFFSASIMASLALVLTWRFGVVGMASSVLLGYLAGAGWFLAVYRRLLSRPLADFFPWRKLLGLCIISFMGPWIASNFLENLLILQGEYRMIQLAYKLGFHFCASFLITLPLFLAWRALCSKLFATGLNAPHVPDANVPRKGDPE